MRLPPGARFCLNCGQSVDDNTLVDEAILARLTAAAPVSLIEKVQSATHVIGERRTVTALFMDVVGSTALAEQVGEERWAAIMNEVCDLACSVIYRFEGTIAQALGDEVLAFFGAPVIHEDDPVRALRAALELLETMRAQAEKVDQEFAVDFAVRISLSSGPVTISSVGDDLRYEYSALGGALNRAAQIEAAKRAMTVLISEDTYRLVAPFFDCVDLGEVTADGQTEAVRVFQVQGIKAVPGRIRGTADLQSPMVGRGSELAFLLQLHEAVKVGLGRAVLIVGEPGLGKTRLVTEWKAAIADDARHLTLRWAEGHCLSYTQGLAYQLLADLLRSLIAVPPTAAEPETRAVLYGLVDELFGEGALEVYPYLGHLLSLKLENTATERLSSLDPRALQTQYLMALRNLLQAMATRGPLILILEDLQWADPSSVELLTRLLPLASAMPILFCLVTRPDRNAPGWQLVGASRDLMGDRLAELALGTLSETNGRQLVANLLALETLPGWLERLILKKTEGNPLFVEEVLRMLIDQGTILRKNGAWVIGAEIEEVDIPDTLQRLLLARTDRLPFEVRHTLRLASVIGREFPIGVLEQVVGSGAVLANHLDALESAGLIRIAQVRPGLAYVFRHALVRDAVYGSLLGDDVRRLHLAVGEAMALLFANRLDEIAPQLAEHFFKAGDEQRALDYFTLAGDAALASYANQEAESLYRRALALARSDDQRADLLRELGRALQRQSRFEEATQIWREGMTAYRALGDSDGLARLYARTARAVWATGDTPGSLEVCREALNEVSEAPESPGLALLLHEAARAYLFNGRSGEARQLGQRALDIAEYLSVVDVQVEALATLGLLSDQAPEAALALLQKAVALSEAAGLLSQAARAHVNMAALLATKLPDFPAARDHYRQAAELQHLRGDAAGELFSYGGMSSVLLEMGRLDEVAATLTVMEPLLSGVGEPGPAAFQYWINQALLRRYRGDLAASTQSLRRLQDEERRRGNLQNLIDIDGYLAEVILESCLLPGSSRVGEWSEAEMALTEAIEICEHWGLSGTYPCCLLSEVRACQGQHEDARHVLAQARERMAATPTVPDEGRLLYAEATVFAAEGRWSAALVAYEAAAAIYGRLEMCWWQARTLMGWSEALAARGEPADLERARTLLQEAWALFDQMKVATYASLAADRLQVLQTTTYAQALVHQQVTQEMVQAGRIQRGFMPEEPPHLPGWQVAARLEPSRITSGDFYDFITLSNGRLGIVVADVADKGAAAALFMALSRSLIRTYAPDFEKQPHLALAETNRRILADTHTDLFVTVFYGVLDPAEGTVTYANAGHDPPYHLKADPEDRVDYLTLTGMPLGVIEDTTWASRSIHLAPGDAMVLYTDGVTDAQNSERHFFGQERLLQSARSRAGQSALELQESILRDVRKFVGDSHQFDDITLVTIVRDSISSL